MAIYKKSLAYATFLLLSLSLCLAIFLWLSLPDVKQLNTCFTTSMNQVSFCDKSPSYVKLSEVPENTLDALLISEDASFYFHSGFDFYEIQTSLVDSLKGDELRGASTISQQLVKNAFLSGEKTFTRKLVEAFVTWRLENTFSKKQILEFYLNMVEFGKNIYGIDHAANHYFSKSPSELDLVESLYLVQLLPNPIKRSDGFFENKISERSLERMKLILDKLLKFERIQKDRYLQTMANLQGPPWYDKSVTNFYIDAFSEDESKVIKEESLEQELYRTY